MNTQPTNAQFYDYRKDLREEVRIIVDSVHHDIIPMTDWAKWVISLNRQRHSASIKRQQAAGAMIQEREKK